jgi:hypothetical protein
VYETYFLPSLGSARNLFNVEVPYVNPAGIKMQLELDFIINSRERNAVCKTVNRSICCGLFSSLPYHFFEIASCCMSHSEFLPFLGPSRPMRKVRELIPETVIYGFAVEHFQDLDLYEQFIGLLQNSNPVRASATFWLMHLMLELYWYHEAGHAIMGHQDYLKEKRGLRVVSEADFGEDLPPVQRERILLEKQADVFAFIQFFSLDSIEGSMRAGAAYGLARDQVCAVRMICVVLVCYSWIWSAFRGTTIKNFNRVKGGLHPPAVVRYELWLRAMRQRTQEKVPNVEDVLRDLEINLELLGKPHPLEPRETFQNAFRILEDQLDVLVNLDATFEGIEHFRNSLGKEIDLNQKQIGHDKVLATMLKNYQYRQVEI